MITKVIGIDPDSEGFQCILVDTETEKTQSRVFYYTESEFIKFQRWVKDEDPIICIEGKNGQCRPLEVFLHENQYPFYSLSPKSVKRFRESVVSENKDNEKDAEAVARLGITLSHQNKLGKYRATVEASNLLETRQFSRLVQVETDKKTKVVNSLWKYVHFASTELYLFLKGSNPKEDNGNNIIQNKGILNLLLDRPNLTEWKNLKQKDLFDSMGGQNYKGRNDLATALIDISPTFKRVDPSSMLAIQMYAKQILGHDDEIKVLEKELEKLTKGDRIVEALVKYRGIGCKTASAIRGEILNPARFKTNDNLASYSGFGTKKVATGSTSRMVPNNSYNRRLKNAFITAAKNLILHNGDKHLTAYFNDLVKNKKVKKNEAYKKVARSWLRTIFREILQPKEVKNNKETGGKTQ